MLDGDLLKQVESRADENSPPFRTRGMLAIDKAVVGAVVGEEFITDEFGTFLRARAPGVTTKDTLSGQ